MRYLFCFLALLAALDPAAGVAAAGVVVVADSITVSAAISLKESLTQIAADYERQSGGHVQLNFGSSGQLAAQIAQGAPADVFISAGEKEMDQLAGAGLIEINTRRNVCGNELALIVPSDAAYVPRSFSDLTDGRIKRLAIGQPKIVPAGLYAQEVMVHLKIADRLAAKLVYGQNVRQVLDYVSRGEVDAGVVYVTDAIAAGGRVKVAAKADASLHSPIVYPAAVVKQVNNSGAGRRFLDYLSGESSRRTLAAHGFVVSPPTTVPTP